jgi:hypothetical protein
LSNGHFNNPQCDHSLMTQVAVEIIPSGAES